MGLQTLPGGALRMKNVTLRLLITFAWDIRDHQLSGGPKWLDTEHFDIDGKPEKEIPANAEGSALRKTMVQSLLKDRFDLEYHRETKETPVYALVVAKNGPKLAPADPGTQQGMMMGRGKLEGKGMKLADLAKILANPLGRTVVDTTGLTGDYTFTLQWTPDVSENVNPKGLPEGPKEAQPQTPDGPSLFTAIQEQLGLKLEARKGPVEMFVVDSVHKPSEN